MNINELREHLPCFDEVQVWPLLVRRGEVLIQLAGAARTNRTVAVYALEYNPAYRAQDEVLGQVVRRPQTEREMWAREQQHQLVFLRVGAITLDGQTFRVAESWEDNLSDSLWEGRLELAEFLRQGMSPHPELARRPVDELYWTVLTLDGAYEALPWAEPPDEETLRLQLRGGRAREALAQQWRWPVGGDYPEPMTFTAADGEHRFYVDQVTLFDPWQQLAQQMEELAEQVLIPNELERCRRQTVQGLSEACPQGQYWPLIQYEMLEEDAWLQLESAAYLDEALHYHLGKPFFLPAPDRQRGDHGGRLHAALLQQAVPADTAEIAVEAVAYERLLPDEILQPQWWTLRAMRYDEIITWHRRTCIQQDAEIQLMGMVRRGPVIRLYALECTESEQADATVGLACDLCHAYSLQMGGTGYQVAQTKTSALSEHGKEGLSVLEAFWAKGWRMSSDMSWRPWHQLRLVEITLDGQYDELPSIGPREAIRFALSEHMWRRRIKQPITVPLDGDYPLTIPYPGGELVITGVRLADPWAILDWLLDDQEVRRSPLYDQLRREETTELARICPEGAKFPVITYREQPDVQLDFRLTAPIELPPADGSDQGYTYVSQIVDGPWHVWPEAGQRAMCLPIPLIDEASAVSFILADCGRKIDSTTVIFH